jgi:hypothetical protein
MIASVSLEDHGRAMALTQACTENAQPAQAPASARGRRCTYRRLGRVDAGAGIAYEVSCLYPDRRIALPLGDLDAASAICGPCAATHVFRPDED